MSERQQTLGEEIANAISHGSGALFAVIAVPFLIAYTALRGSGINLAGSIIFSATLILLYLTSTIYHALPRGRAKTLFCKLDHSAIYFLIAGTYTPFTLGVLRGAWGSTILTIIWGLAFVGVILKVRDRLSHSTLSLMLYLVMGWLILVAIGPLVMRMNSNGLIWLAAGGVSYTGGVIFYVFDNRIRYAHFVWHLWVLMGSVCHFFAVLWYAA